MTGQPSSWTTVLETVRCIPGIYHHDVKEAPTNSSGASGAAGAKPRAFFLALAHRLEVQITLHRPAQLRITPACGILLFWNSLPWASLQVTSRSDNPHNSGGRCKTVRWHPD